MSKITKQDVIDSTLAIHGAGEMVSKTYAISVIELAEERIAALEQQLKTAKPKYYRHLKTGGIYEFIADAEMESNLEDVVVYQSVEHKSVWVRPSKEFYDGRFEEYANNLEGK